MGMEKALLQAEHAAENGEVPVGAVLFIKDEIVAEAGNAPISRNDPTAHAEILVLRKAAETVNNYRLPGSTLYVTLEPCAMCVGAIIHARVPRVVFGAVDAKTGALVSCYQMGSDGKLNHHLEVIGGVLENRCAEVLRTFFSSRRKKRT